MATRTLERHLIDLMPRARRYARALIGDTETADIALSSATLNLIDKAPGSSFLTPHKMVLPWLFIELHKELDQGSPVTNNTHNTAPNQFESAVYEQIDSGLNTLSHVQKRAYLLTALEQFPLATTAHVLGQPIEQVKQHFQQSHTLINEHLNELLESTSGGLNQN